MARTCPNCQIAFRHSPLDTHDKVHLGLSGNVEVAVGLGLAAEADLLTLLLVVLVDVLLGTLEDDLTLGLAGLQKRAQACQRKSLRAGQLCSRTASKLQIEVEWRSRMHIHRAEGRARPSRYVRSPAPTSPFRPIAVPSAVYAEHCNDRPAGVSVPHNAKDSNTTRDDSEGRPASPCEPRWRRRASPRPSWWRPCASVHGEMITIQSARPIQTNPPPLEPRTNLEQRLGDLDVLGGPGFHRRVHDKRPS